MTCRATILAKSSKRSYESNTASPADIPPKGTALVYAPRRGEAPIEVLQATPPKIIPAGSNATPPGTCLALTPVPSSPLLQQIEKQEAGLWVRPLLLTLRASTNSAR